MSQDANQTTVENPEVLPPENGGGTQRARRPGQRAVDAFGPIAAGMVIDAVDFMARGPIGLMIAMVVGGTLTYAFATYYGLSVWKRLAWAAAAGLYCLLPRTQFIPLGIIVGAAVQYFREERR